MYLYYDRQPYYNIKIIHLIKEFKIYKEEY